MTTEQKLVKEFHEKFGLTTNSTPTMPNSDDILLRMRLIDEESEEFSAAVSLAETADALGDLLYVVYGAAVTYGIDLEPVFKEIHRSNMSKVWADGSVKKDSYGKVIKPPTYSPANITEELSKQSKTL